MAKEGPSISYTTQILVALIGLAGVIATAVFSNWDKLFPARGADAPAKQAAAPAGPAEPVEKVAESQRKAYSATSDALDDVTARIAGANVADLSGQWQGANGYSYRVQQDGADYSFAEFVGGAQSGSGEGSIEGRNVTQHGISGGVAVSCQGKLNAAGTAIAGTCSGGGESWAYRVTR